LTDRLRSIDSISHRAVDPIRSESTSLFKSQSVSSNIESRKAKLRKKGRIRWVGNVDGLTTSYGFEWGFDPTRTIFSKIGLALQHSAHERQPNLGRPANREGNNVGR